jgi:hypothetical protein
MHAVLDKLIAFCRERGIEGSYRAWHDPPWWRARVKLPGESYLAPAETREAALDRAAGAALSSLVDPQPSPGTDGYAAWEERRKALRS